MLEQWILESGSRERATAQPSFIGFGIFQERLEEIGTEPFQQAEDIVSTYVDHERLVMVIVGS